MYGILAKSLKAEAQIHDLMLNNPPVAATDEDYFSTFGDQLWEMYGEIN